ncbi:MAG TPA: hypothetical protein PKC40_14770, partial [Saprospiraceae bacterium]|nr:hypothetical protein [Saprospiraceae bacterium]
MQLRPNRFFVVLIFTTFFRFSEMSAAEYAEPPVSLICNLAFPEAVQTDQYTIRIPFRMAGYLPVVSAKI